MSTYMSAFICSENVTDKIVCFVFACSLKVISGYNLLQYYQPAVRHNTMMTGMCD